MGLQQLELFDALPSTPELEKKVVFANEKIKVKLKEKTTVTNLPVKKIEEVPNIVSPETITANSNKRGRKSYKENYTNIDDMNVPDDETLHQKLYYSISEVAAWFNVATSQIRFWENEFDILQPRKNRKGDRLFRVEDIKNLQLIYYLLRNRKFSLEGAKEYLKGNKHKAELHLQLVESLTKFRSFLVELKTNLTT